MLKNQRNGVSLEERGGCGRKGNGPGNGLEVSEFARSERGDTEGPQVSRAIAWDLKATGSILHLPRATEVSDRNMNRSSRTEGRFL